MMAELRILKANLANKDTAPRKWTKEDERKLVSPSNVTPHAFSLRRTTLSQHRLRLPQKVVSQFAANRQGVIVLFEEVAMARDSLAIVSLLVSLLVCENMQGLILVGDNDQTNTLVLSARLFDASHKLAHRSLFDRLQASGFHIMVLTEQYYRRSEFPRVPERDIIAWMDHQQQPKPWP
jgi:hypothetical protein